MSRRSFVCLCVMALFGFAVFTSGGCGGGGHSSFVEDPVPQSGDVPAPTPEPTSGDTPAPDPSNGDSPASQDVTPEPVVPPMPSPDINPVPEPTSGDMPPTPPASGDRPVPPTPTSGDVPPAPPASGDNSAPAPAPVPTSDDVPAPVSDDVPANPTSGDSSPVSGDEEGETYSTTVSMQNALLVNGESKSYRNITVIKTGDATGQSDQSGGYDWTGTNAAILAKGGAKLIISGAAINSDAVGGNAVFSYGGNNSPNSNNRGDGTTITISDSTIVTSKNNSGGIMTTGGGVMNASNLTITTAGGSSAAIRSDSGGGTVTVNGGTYTTNGHGSPAIYSTADIDVFDATLTSNVSQVVVIEGGNSVELTDSTLNANHNRFNGNDSTYQAVLIYQSFSGDASNGSSSFKMTDGSLTNVQGDIFCVTNTTTTITLSGADIHNSDASGNFLRAEGQKWGNSGSNGGKVTLNADGQTINGDMLIASDSTLALNMTNSSVFNGAINPSGQAGSVSVTLDSTSKWTLTGNSYITALTNSGGTIDKGTYTLYVNGVAQE